MVPKGLIVLVILSSSATMMLTLLVLSGKVLIAIGWIAMKFG